MLEAGRRDVAEVRVAEAVASGEVVCVGPRATADGRVDSAQQCARLARLVTRPVDCRQLAHYSSVHVRTVEHSNSGKKVSRNESNRIDSNRELECSSAQPNRSENV